MTASTTNLTIDGTPGRVGAEVRGLTAEQLADDDAAATALLDALETFGVLVFRGLDLHQAPEVQVAFARRLGELDLDEEGYHPVKGIQRVTLDKEKRPTAEYTKGTFLWHIDGCTPVADVYPQKATMLTAAVVAATGGDTEFASSYRAYDDLSDEEKERFAGVRVAHTLESSMRQVYPDPTPEQVAGWRSRTVHVHPLVWTHRSGRKSLVIGSSADYVVDMDLDEGRALLADLVERATGPGKVFRHSWSVGDTVIWDNRGVLHRAEPYDVSSQREMLRTTILGDEPIQ